MTAWAAVFTYVTMKIIEAVTGQLNVSPEYASRAVQFHPHGGQLDSVWLPARTIDAPTCGLSVRVVSPTKSLEKNTHPENYATLRSSVTHAVSL